MPCLATESNSFSPLPTGWSGYEEAGSNAVFCRANSLRQAKTRNVAAGAHRGLGRKTVLTDQNCLPQEVPQTAANPGKL